MKLFKSKEHGYVLELWGSSTKHPDSVFYFSDFKKSEFINENAQVYQWLLECASKLNFFWDAKEIVDYANEKWYPEKGWEEPELTEYSTDHWYTR